MGEIMKKISLVVLMMLLFVCRAEAAIILESGLVLEDGAERIVMQPGEKKYLKIRDSIWNMPVYKNLEFSSKYPSVATVDARGFVRAMLPGRTVISVWNDVGDNGTIEVFVEGNRKFSSVGWCILGALGGVIFVFYIKNKFRCF